MSFEPATFEFFEKSVALIFDHIFLSSDKELTMFSNDKPLVFQKIVGKAVNANAFSLKVPL
jgi:hypothetical protein